MSLFIFTLWPGLAGLIRFGRLPFFFLALGFSAAAGGSLLLTGYWSEWFAGSAKITIFAGLAAVWLILTLISLQLSAHYKHQLAYDRSGDRFLRILDSYLAGDWTEAERQALALLKQNHRDPDVLLLLAALNRHTGKRERAHWTLNQLEKLETSSKWSFEIAAERELLNEPDEADPKTNPIKFSNNQQKTSETIHTFWPNKQTQAG